jgi:hypothetical protein
MPVSLMIERQFASGYPTGACGYRPDMDHRTLALAHASGRIAAGAALALAPGTVGRAWVGRAGGTPGARVITTAMGARDAAIGLGLADALRGGGEPSGWIRAAVLADLVDLTATLRARRDVPALALIGVSALAAGSAALGVYLDRALAQAP